jgi:hypothetical protein
MPSLLYGRPSASVALIARRVATTVFQGHPFTTTSRGSILIPGNSPSMCWNHFRTASWPRRSPPSSWSPENRKRDCGPNCRTTAS